MRFVFVSCSLFLFFASVAQPGTTAKVKIDIKRQLFHDYVDREQKNALKADGKADLFFKASENEEINFLVTQALTKKVDDLQMKIETDPQIAHGSKVSYLRGIENMLKNFSARVKTRRFSASNWPQIIEVYALAMQKDIKGESIEPLISANTYDIGNMVLLSAAFDKNPGRPAAKNILILKYATLHPDQVFSLLTDNYNVPFRDSLLIVAGHNYPRLLYDYASANNKLGNAIRRINDTLVRTISRMATSGGNGQVYFPFLDNILKGHVTLQEIDAVKNDDAKYYKLLVKTRIDYVSRALQKDSIFGMQDLYDRLKKKANDIFIRTINGLHEEPDAVRFRILQQLNAQELYYLAVAGEDEIYTSSFVNGVYPAAMSKIGNRGDSLLLSVNFDRFKKFIRIAAGYNTLSNFLASFPDSKQAKTLMTVFVSNLEKSEGLEDGVDVADSYASVVETIKPVAEDMLNNIRLSYERNLATGNKRGIVIYNLLSKLCRSATDSSIDLSKELGIPPVYNVNYESLVDPAAKKVVMQVFFYGDEDGKMNYSGFIPQFANGNWKQTDNTKYWVSFSSTKGKPTIVYANKWFNDEKQPGELDKAQETLTSFLEEKGIQPTIVVHRGHSYWVSTTIKQIQPAAKIVLLGSCGGYNVIHDVLQHSPDAHIVASKQTGKMYINQPFLNILNEKIRNGNNIDWIPFWNEFRAKAGKIEGFEDYIPPYKNLGAIFIKAYNIQMGEEEGISLSKFDAH
jgi:hypothetical protein